MDAAERAQREMSLDGYDDGRDGRSLESDLMDAIDAVGERDEITWLSKDGERKAAIVPGRIAELGAYPLYLYNGETGEVSVVSAVRAEAELRALCVRAFTLLESAEQMCPGFGERENVRLWRERYHACQWGDDSPTLP